VQPECRLRLKWKVSKLQSNRSENTVDAINTLRTAIGRVREPRYFSTERGYQGQLLSELDGLVAAETDDFTRPIVEQEYQKRAHEHGITLRPDIIIHIPFERGASPTRRDDNHLVILLDLSADKAEAEEDFGQLSTICCKLNYPIGAFINISSTDLWLPDYIAKIDDSFRLYEFAVSLDDGCLRINEAES